MDESATRKRKKQKEKGLSSEKVEKMDYLVLKNYVFYWLAFDDANGSKTKN